MGQIIRSVMSVMPPVNSIAVIILNGFWRNLAQ